MKNSIKIIFLFFSITLFSQNPWTKEKGTFYSQISFTTIPNYTELFGNPDYTTNGKISDNTIQLYGEYGFSNKTTILLNIPYKSISNKGLVHPCLVAPCPQYTNKKKL